TLFRSMGEQHATITIAAIYQRSGQISSPGGYLRSLTDKAREGKFSTWPMIMALARAKLDENRKPDITTDAERDAGPRLEVSDALLKTLQKPRNRP
ncbi:MAG: replication initiation protein RepC, partial [Flavobacteriaceae bacterium]